MTDKNQPLDDIADKIAGGLRLLGDLRQGAESQVRAVVENALSQFDVVTHEQMQVQEAMLKKAREELQALDARVHELETRIKEMKK